MKTYESVRVCMEMWIKGDVTNDIRINVFAFWESCCVLQKLGMLVMKLFARFGVVTV